MVETDKRDGPNPIELYESFIALEVSTYTDNSLLALLGTCRLRTRHFKLMFHQHRWGWHE